MKRLVLFLLVIIFLQITVSAETVLLEDDLNAGTFSQTEFFTYFGMYNANENNYEFDGENGYYHGKWTEGASAFYYDLLEDYTFMWILQQTVLPTVPKCIQIIHSNSCS